MSPHRTEEEELVDELKVPEFKSTIPSHLIDGLSKSEQHILSTLSVIAQKQDFLFSVLAHDRKVLRLTKKRTDKYDRLLLVLSSKWSVILYIIAALYPVLSNKLIQKLWP